MSIHEDDLTTPDLRPVLQEGHAPDWQPAARRYRSIAEDRAREIGRLRLLIDRASQPLIQTPLPPFEGGLDAGVDAACKRIAQLEAERAELVEALDRLCWEAVDQAPEPEDADPDFLSAVADAERILAKHKEQA